MPTNKTEQAASATPGHVASTDGLGAWVSVRDRMPPPDTWLLVVWGGHSAVDKAHTFTKWRHATSTHGYLIQGHPGSHNDVRYWMHLPQPPQAPNVEAKRRP